jgi:hypothetical protein
MVKYARKVASISPMKDMIVKELNPGLEVQTDEQWAGASRFCPVNEISVLITGRMAQVNLQHYLA